VDSIRLRKLTNRLTAQAGLRVKRKFSLLAKLGADVADDALARFIARFLFGVAAVDPLTFVCIPLLLFAIALLASYVPARYATKVDPNGCPEIRIARTRVRPGLNSAPFPAHHRAAEKVMPEFVVYAVDPENRGNLRPMPDFVHDNMDRDFVWGCCDEEAEDLHLSWNIPLRRWKRFEKML